VILGSVLLVIFASLVGVWWFMKYRVERARAAWKGPALDRVAALSITNEEIHRDLDELKAESDRRWAHEHVLLMTNGAYILYAFRHGANSGFVDHLFLGHCSDGRWVYSTYHFCNSMVGVMSDDPPGSLTEFCRTYSAREFDGKSDECLRHTWPTNR